MTPRGRTIIAPPKQIASQQTLSVLHLKTVGNNNNTYTYHLRKNSILSFPDAETQEAGGPARLPMDSPQRRRLPPLLRRAWYGINQAFRRRIARLGVTPDQFTVMRTLLEGDPCGLSQRQLSELISSDPNTVASLLERMESAGLIERKRHETDRRAHRIRLLTNGKRKYERAREEALALQAEILAVLPKTEREGFLENLSLIADRCRQAADGVRRPDRKALRDQPLR